MRKHFVTVGSTSWIPGSSFQHPEQENDLTHLSPSTSSNYRFCWTCEELAVAVAPSGTEIWVWLSILMSACWKIDGGDANVLSWEMKESQTSDLNSQLPDDEFPVLTEFHLIYYLITQTHNLISNFLFTYST